MVSDFEPLSPQQKKVYEFIRESFYSQASMPSVREICHAMGWKAVGSAQSAIKALIQKNWIHRDPYKARGLQLNLASSFRNLPILGSAPAGPPVEAIENHSGDVMVPSFIRGPVFAIRVQGDSMVGAGIHDHDLVIVKQSSQAENKEIIVALIDGETTIKRLIKKNKEIWLQPENPKYKSKKITDPSFRILGKVIGLHRYWEDSYLITN